MEVNFPPVVGLCGRAGAGKGEVAAYLSREYGYIEYSLASPIKKLLNDRFGWTTTQWEDRAWKEAANVGGFSPRSWAQWLGTEVGRMGIGERSWVNLLLMRAYDAAPRRELLVVPDVRFANEVTAIRYVGGIVVSVARDAAERPALGQSEAGHSSEAVDDLPRDYSINNNGTLANLYKKIDLRLAQWHEMKEFVKRSRRGE